MFTGQSWLIAHDSVKRDLRVTLYNRGFSCSLTGFDLKIIQFTNGFFLLLLKPLARFRRRSFHESNLIHWIKYMKSLASESIRNAYFNWERLSHSFCLAQPGISPLERLWNDFDSDAKLFTYRIKSINYHNIFCKSLTEMGTFRLMNLVQVQF